MMHSAVESLRDIDWLRERTFTELADIIGLRHTRMLMASPADKVLKNGTPLIL